MAEHHPFRFSVVAPMATSGAEFAATARQVETLGYDTLFVSDHLGSQVGEQLAPIPAMVAAALSTGELRVGTMVLSNDFRHPAVLAKDLATADLLTDGRVEWGMGAGWLAPEYRATGIPFSKGPERVSRLEESLAVMKLCFTGTEFDFAGTHYQMSGFTSTPAPVQRPHPPLTVGGSRRRILSLAAREADTISINPHPSATGGLGGREPTATPEEAFDQQVKWIRDAASGRAVEPELSVTSFTVSVTDDGEDAIETMSQSRSVPPERIRSDPRTLVGSQSALCDRLESVRERWGVSHWVVPPTQIESFAPVVSRLSGR